ncbi:MAG TPA: hypothetical protein VK801_04755 [Caulobacteraceae bacterium]|jgi:hypothetical protein|nr:hypothetical protein [Caulobacteraceae bacterium]
MKPLFPHRSVAAPGVGARETQAYREGRIDERRDEAAGAGSASRAQIRAANRRRRGGVPILGLLVLLVVIFGSVMLYLAAENGSFARGGAVVDRDLSQATQPVRRAEDRTGQALQNAGEHLQKDAGAPSQ